MHVHLPKPLHGWREFLGEVGIIVIGVLIALGAEQAVEAWHWHEAVATEREALDEEVGNYLQNMHVRVEMQPCIDHRLAELATLFDRHDAGKPLGRLGPVGRPVYGSNSRAAWDMAVADQSFAHMPSAMRVRYAAVASSYQIYVNTTQGERDAWITLQQFDHAEHLSPSSWDDLRKAYDAAADASGILKRALIEHEKTEWLVPFKGFPRAESVPLNSVKQVANLCRPMILR